MPATLLVLEIVIFKFINTSSNYQKSYVNLRWAYSHITNIYFALRHQDRGNTVFATISFLQGHQGWCSVHAQLSSKPRPDWGSTSPSQHFLSTGNVIFSFPSCLSIKWPLIISLFISIFILVMTNATLTFFFITFLSHHPALYHALASNSVSRCIKHFLT